MGLGEAGKSTPNAKLSSTGFFFYPQGREMGPGDCDEQRLGCNATASRTEPRHTTADALANKKFPYYARSRRKLNLAPGCPVLRTHKGDLPML